jgi:hypothetical protein
VPPGGFEELASPTTPAEVQVSYTAEPQGNGPGPPAGRPQAVDTVLGAHPRRKVGAKGKRAAVSFSFSSSLGGATFECSLDRAPFRPCSSPARYRVKPGRHVFAVRAGGAAGADPTPAGFSFRVKRNR